MNEHWKDIFGYENCYQVSDLGRFRSIDREIVYSTGRIQKLKGQLLSPSKQRTGYYTVGLYDQNHKGKTLSAHRVVASHFVPNPNNLPEVNHIDGDKSNNSAINLEWVTAKTNNQHARCNGRNHPSMSPQCKAVRCINTGQEFYSTEECARNFRVTADTVRRKLIGDNVPSLQNVELEYV